MAVPFPPDNPKRPALRFRDEHGNAFPEWEEKRLGEVAKVTTGSSNREDSEDVGEYAFFDRSNDQRWSSKFLYDCEALIVAGEGKDFPPRYFHGKFDLHQRAYAITGFEKVYAKFLFHWVNWHRRHFLKFSVGSTMPSLRMAAFNKFPVSLPSPPEQRKIADFLSAVDRRVAHLTEKKRLLEAYKKGCMQKLFSQEIRFRDEQGNAFPEWEVKRLGEVGTFTKGKGISKADIAQEGGNLCIRYGELYTEYSEYIPRVVSRTKAQLKGAVLSRKNDILMPTSAETPSGLATASALDIEDVILGSDILIIRSKEILNRFFSYFVAANKSKIMRLVTGVTVYHMYGSDLASLHLNLPSPPEQRKIADLLSAVDRRIEVAGRQVEGWQAYKRGLMQGLFPR